MNNLALQQKAVIDNVFRSKHLNIESFRANLDLLEGMLKAVPGVTLRDDDRTPLNHHFAPGLYGREIFIPKGYILTTGIHATEHIAIISGGSCLVATENGIEQINAPYTMITKVGTKRAIFVQEDLTWTTVHAIDVETPEEAIEMIEYKTWEDLACLSG